MKIGVVIEGSTKHRNGDVVRMLEGRGHEIYNLGMKDIQGEPDLTYMETGLISAVLLNLKAVDFVVGGCETGQGYLNAVLQFPGMACGLLSDPTDAFLFAKVNSGNCVSLALNKGYGALGGDVNLGYLFDKLFEDEFGGGYPSARAGIQKNARERLARLSLDAHRLMVEILALMDQVVVKSALSFPGVGTFIQEHAPNSELKKAVLALV